MGWLRFFRRSHWDRERREELESYIAIETDDNIARAHSRSVEVRARALRTVLRPFLRAQDRGVPPRDDALHHRRIRPEGRRALGGIEDAESS